jgi:hypothetical protein
MPDLIRHPETYGLETVLDSRLRGNDKTAAYAFLPFVTQPPAQE